MCLGVLEGASVSPQCFLKCLHKLIPFFFGATSNPASLSSMRISTNFGGNLRLSLTFFFPINGMFTSAKAFPFGSSVKWLQFKHVLGFQSSWISEALNPPKMLNATNDLIFLNRGRAEASRSFSTSFRVKTLGKVFLVMTGVSWSSIMFSKL